jgi:hypothetical protein
MKLFEFTVRTWNLTCVSMGMSASAMPSPAPPPGLGLSGSSSSKYCRYLAYNRRKINYHNAPQRKKIYLLYAACSTTWAGTQQILQLEVLPISCLYEKKNKLCHQPQKIY